MHAALLARELVNPHVADLLRAQRCSTYSQGMKAIRKFMNLLMVLVRCGTGVHHFIRVVLPLANNSAFSYLEAAVHLIDESAQSAQQLRATAADSAEAATTP